MHTSPSSPGILPKILDRAGPLPAEHATDGEAIQHGRIYVAPPDHHMIIKRNGVHVVHGPRENGFRPAVDPLFRTAARAFRRRVVGVVLSGGLDDGTEGLMRIKACGGCAIVQDPEEAVFPSMPAHAARYVEVDHVVSLAQIPSILAELAKAPIGAEGAAVMNEAECPSDEDRLDMSEVGNAGLRTGNLPGPPSGFTCPECGGALWELSNEGLLRYRCHVGHAYTAEGLATEHARKLEMALWTALRALEENAAIRRRMSERSKGQRWETLASEYERQAKDSEERAALIREVLVSDPLKNPAPSDIPREPDPAIPETHNTGNAARRAVRASEGDGNGANGGRAKPGRTSKAPSRKRKSTAGATSGAKAAGSGKSKNGGRTTR
jgi:two-component system chemotaxis response regulator CheB